MKDQAPYIHAGESVSGMMGKAVGALLPASIVSLVFFRLDGLWITLASLAGAVSAEIFAAEWFRIKTSPGDGSSIFTALLYALLLPADTAAWMAVLGAFFAVFAGKMCFGGLGGNPFNPALIGRIFLQISFPQAMNWPAMVETAGASNFFIAALASGGVLLLWLKVTDWGPPLFYFAAGSIFSFLSGFGPSFFPAASLTYLTAIFVITDPATTPLGRRGAGFFAVLAAALTLFLKSRGANYLQATAYSILIMNAVVPWLDARFTNRRRTER